MGEELLLLNPFARIWFLEVRNWAVAFYRSIAVFAFGFFIFIFNSRVLSLLLVVLNQFHCDSFQFNSHTHTWFE